MLAVRCSVVSACVWAMSSVQECFLGSSGRAGVAGTKDVSRMAISLVLIIHFHVGNDHVNHYAIANSIIVFLNIRSSLF
jgi:hypothetical protein